MFISCVHDCHDRQKVWASVVRHIHTCTDLVLINSTQEWVWDQDVQTWAAISEVVVPFLYLSAPKKWTVGPWRPIVRAGISYYVRIASLSCACPCASLCFPDLTWLTCMQSLSCLNSGESQVSGNGVMDYSFYLFVMDYSFHQFLPPVLCNLRRKQDFQLHFCPNESLFGIWLDPVCSRSDHASHTDIFFPYQCHYQYHQFQKVSLPVPKSPVFGSWSPNSTYLHLYFYLLSWRWWPLWSDGTLYQWSLQPEKASQDPCLFKISVSCT